MESAPTLNGNGRITAPRAVLALLVFLLLLVGSLGYHDGAFGTAPLGSDPPSTGPVRFKGRLDAWDAQAQTFRLHDASGDRSFHWNITTPKTGQVYVVDAQKTAAGDWVALALTRTLVFEGRWT
jgi:hypothetical protein